MNCGAHCVLVRHFHWFHWCWCCWSNRFLWCRTRCLARWCVVCCRGLRCCCYYYYYYCYYYYYHHCLGIHCQLVNAPDYNSDDSIHNEGIPSNHVESTQAERREAARTSDWLPPINRITHFDRGSLERYCEQVLFRYDRMLRDQQQTKWYHL